MLDTADYFNSLHEASEDSQKTMTSFKSSSSISSSSVTRLPLTSLAELITNWQVEPRIVLGLTHNLVGQRVIAALIPPERLAQDKTL
jgi:hypothetical protein